jgi:hypothetical protein
LNLLPCSALPSLSPRKEKKKKKEVHRLKTKPQTNKKKRKKFIIIIFVFGCCVRGVIKTDRGTTDQSEPKIKAT